MIAQGPLLPAEQALLDRLTAGERLELDPRAPVSDRTVRGCFITALYVDAPPGGRPLNPNGFPVVMSNALISGDLDLRDLRGPAGSALPALHLENCRLPGLLKLNGTYLRRLSLRDSALHHLQAQDTHFEGLVDLRGVHSAGDMPGAGGEPRCHVALSNTRIDGDLWAAQAQFCAPPPEEAEARQLGRPVTYALDLRGAEIFGSVRLDPKVRAVGGVTLADARISGDVWLRGAELIAAEGAAFRAQNTRIEGALVGRYWEEPEAPTPHQALRAHGMVWMPGAQIGGEVDMRGIMVRRRPGSRDGRFVAVGMKVGGSLRMRASDQGGARSCFDDGVHLTNAEINGELTLAGARLGADNDGVSLSLEGATIRKSLHLGCRHTAGGAWERFEADGSTSLRVLDIADDLILAGGVFRGEIDASNLTVGGDLNAGPADPKDRLPHGDAELDLVAPRLQAPGRFRLQGAMIGKQLCLVGARLDRLDAQDVVVAGRIDLKGAEVRHRLDLQRARARGRLSLEGLTLISVVDDEGSATTPEVLLNDCVVEGVLRVHKVRRMFALGDGDLQPLAAARKVLRGGKRGSKALPRPVMQLTGTQVDLLDDLIGRGWGDVKLFLDDFRYRATYRVREPTSSLTPGLNAVRHRLVWLDQQFDNGLINTNTFRSQPYVQLAEVYRGEGRFDEASQIIIRKLDLEKMLERRARWRTRLKFDLWPRSRPNQGLCPTILRWATSPLAGLWWCAALAWSVVWVLATTLVDQAFKSFFGYGLDPRRSMVTLAGFLALGIAGTLYANSHDLLVVDAAPSLSQVHLGTPRFDPRLAYESARPPTLLNVHCGEEVAAPLYAFDLFVPVVDLHQKGRCMVRPFDETDQARWDAAIRDSRPTLTAFKGAALTDLARRGRAAWAIAQRFSPLVMTDPRVWLWLKTIYAFLGWLVVSLTLLTISGILKRNAEK